MIRRTVAPFLVALGLLFTMAVGTAAPSLSAPAHATQPRRCYNYQLAIRYVSGGAALGHIGIIYRIHNLTGTPCTLQGYPGARLFDRRFHSMPTHVRRGGGYIIAGRPHEPLVTLDSRHDAYFGLEFHDVPAGNQSCPDARYLMITPPDDYLPIVIRSEGIAPCGGQIILSPVHSSNTVS